MGAFEDNAWRFDDCVGEKAVEEDGAADVCIAVGGVH